MKISDYNKVTDRISPSERCRREVLDMANRKNRERITHKRIKGRTAAVIIGLAVAEKNRYKDASFWKYCTARHSK